MVQKFSDQEKSFLLEHILYGVPVESFAYRVILETVMNGANTPEKIDGALKEKYVSKDRAEQLSQSFLTSQRSGAISRMSDLGLIERQRDRVRVFYRVTEAGRSFLSQYNGSQQLSSSAESSTSSDLSLRMKDFLRGGPMCDL
jgi:hypothetical protein